MWNTRWSHDRRSLLRALAHAFIAGVCLLTALLGLTYPIIPVPL